MKIAVIGATGVTGRHFVAQALKNGHMITALARSPKSLEAMQHPQLEIIQGDALNLSDMQRVVGGKDAVFCALGHGESTQKTTVRQQGTQQIVMALAQLGEQPHLVVVSSLGVGDSKMQMPFVARTIVTFILRHPLADHEGQEALVKSSKLPWTILRPTSLNDDPATGEVHVTLAPHLIKAQPSISRADVALFALKVIEARSHLQQAVTLSSPNSA